MNLKLSLKKISFAHCVGVGVVGAATFIGPRPPPAVTHSHSHSVTVAASQSRTHSQSHCHCSSFVVRRSSFVVRSFVVRSSAAVWPLPLCSFVVVVVGGDHHDDTVPPTTTTTIWDRGQGTAARRTQTTNPLLSLGRGESRVERCWVETKDCGRTTIARRVARSAMSDSRRLMLG
mgnify:CR=1 FL=1